MGGLHCLGHTRVNLMICSYLDCRCRTFGVAILTGTYDSIYNSEHCHSDEHSQGMIPIPPRSQAKRELSASARHQTRILDGLTMVYLHTHSDSATHKHHNCSARRRLSIQIDISSTRREYVSS